MLREERKSAGIQLETGTPQLQTDRQFWTKFQTDLQVYFDLKIINFPSHIQRLLIKAEIALTSDGVREIRPPDTNIVHVVKGPIQKFFYFVVFTKIRFWQCQNDCKHETTCLHQQRRHNSNTAVGRYKCWFQFGTKQPAALEWIMNHYFIWKEITILQGSHQISRIKIRIYFIQFASYFGSNFLSFWLQFFEFAG